VLCSSVTDNGAHDSDDIRLNALCSVKLRAIQFSGIYIPVGWSRVPNIGGPTKFWQGEEKPDVSAMSPDMLVIAFFAFHFSPLH